MKPIFCFVFVALCAMTAFGQHNNRSARDLQFRFGNPGARSMALGGAFLGLADDATAPVVNPAGMGRTQSRAVAWEVAYNRDDKVVPFHSGRVVQTNLFEFDFQFTPAQYTQRDFSVPFLAMIWPKGSMRFGFFIHQQADEHFEYTTQRIDFDLLTTSSTQLSYAPSHDVMKLEMMNLGASVGSRLGRHFLWGISTFWSQLDYRADSTIELTDVVGTPQPVSQTARGDDGGWGAILGLIFSANELFSVGLNYKFQPRFDYSARLSATVPNPDNPDFSVVAPFDIPDSLGVGLCLRPSDRTTLNVDANRVYYGQITDHLVDFSGVEDVTQTMPDVTEIHLGFEWAFPDLAFPLFWRLGFWKEPYHAATNNIQDSQILRGSSQQPQVRDIFFLNRFAEDLAHYAMGIGITCSQSFQLDAAVDVADDGETLCFSGVYRF